MRCVSLVDHVEFDHKGSMFQNAICLVDIDGDGCNELCICNSNGDLSVFKGENEKAWRYNKDVGCIAVLCKGRLRAGDRNVLCALDTEGWCTLFDAGPAFPPVVPLKSEESSRSSQHSTPVEPLRILHRQKLEPNSKVALLEDVDSDGFGELIVGYTDRYVRVYKWKPSLHKEVDPVDVLPMSAFSTATRGPLTKQGSKDEERRSLLSFTLQSSKDVKEAFSSPVASPIPVPAVGDLTFPFEGDFGEQSRCGRFALVQQFALFTQLGSLAVSHAADGSQQVVVSQLNGGYCVLATYTDGCTLSEPDTPVSGDSPMTWKQDSYQTFYPIPTPKSREGYVNTEVAGGIRRKGQPSGVLGLCTETGAFMILDSHCHVLPAHRKSEHQWFVIDVMDEAGTGDDDVVLCSMDGMTYVIDSNGDIVSFHFRDNVVAFRAGSYGVQGQNVPCLCYVNVSGRVFLYHHLNLRSTRVRDLHSALIERLEEDVELKRVLDSVRLPSGEIDRLKLSRLVQLIWSARRDDMRLASNEPIDNRL